MEGGREVTKERRNADCREEKGIVRFYKNSKKTKRVKTMTILRAQCRGQQWRRVMFYSDVLQGLSTISIDWCLGLKSGLRRSEPINVSRRIKKLHYTDMRVRYKDGPHHSGLRCCFVCVHKILLFCLQN